MPEEKLRLEKREILEITKNIREIKADLSTPRTIKVWGYDKKGHKIERILMVTDKGKLALV